MSTNMIAVHLPDGAIREVPSGTTPLDIANSISPRLAAASIAARISPVAPTAVQKTAPGNDEPSEAAMYAAEDSAAPRLVDLSAPLTSDTRLELVKENDPDALKVLRHSSAHVLATAVLELFPETKLGHGPATDSGFFYDFYREKPFTPEDLAAIEAKMAEVVARNEPFIREYEPREQALAEFERDGDFMKTHFVTKFTAARLTRSASIATAISSTSAAARTCPPPAASKPSRSPASPAPTGSATRRIRSSSASTAPPSSRKKISTRTSPALKKPRERDHRVLGKQLDLFSIQELAGAGLIFWHPKGAMIRKMMEDWMRDECLRRGYQLVYTPHVCPHQSLADLRPRRLLRRQHVHAHGA